MAPRCGLRAQLAIPGQGELYDYWRTMAGSHAVPGRAAFDPCCVPRLLPHISLIESAGDSRTARFRLAGSALRDLYGRDVTGAILDHVFAGPRAAYWRRVHGLVVERGAAMQGAVHGPAEGREHLVLFWLRLPLVDERGRVRFILCHDAWRGASTVPDAMGIATTGALPSRPRQPAYG